MQLDRMENSPVRFQDDILKLGVLGTLFALVVVPLLFIVAASFGYPRSFSYNSLYRLLEDDGLFRIAVNTVVLGVLVVIIAVALGTTLAFALERITFRGSEFAEKLLIVPILVSPLIVTVAWVTLARPRTGFLNVAWRSLLGNEGTLINIYSVFGMVLVLTLNLTPYVFLLVRSSLQNLDGSMEEAAAMLGAGRTRIWIAITLPLVKPAVYSSAILVFVLTIETFSVVGILGGPARFVTFPFNIYLAVNLPPGDWNYAALQGGLLILLTVTLMLIYWRVIGDLANYRTVGGRAHRIPTRESGVLSIALAAVVWSFILFAVLLPMAALIFQSFQQFSASRFDDMNFTLGNWQTILKSTAFQTAVINTAVVGIAAATLATIISVFVSHLSVFDNNRLLDLISTLPLAYPGIVLGMALVFMYSGTSVYGTLFLLIIAYTTQFLPFTTRAVTATMTQLDKGLDEAGKMVGASLFRRIAKLTGPMLRPTIGRAWLLAFTRGIRELNLSIFLYTPSTIVIPVLIWNFMEQGAFGLASALSIFQVVLILSLLTIAGAAERK